MLVGVTGIGLVDYQDTPLGERMPGVEIHAQLLENLYDGTLLMRPPWARWLETALFVALGLHADPRRAAVAHAGDAVIARARRDASVPALGGARGVHVAGGCCSTPRRPRSRMLALFATLLVLTLGEANAQRRALRRVMQREREQAARIAGELEAARRIQMAMLPRVDAFARTSGGSTSRRRWCPAREVGGDLYDSSASTAAAVLPRRRRRRQGPVGEHLHGGEKALYKSAALRQPDDDVGALMTRRERARSRATTPRCCSSPLFAGILDLEPATLVYCNAGHDDPYCVGTRSGLRRARGRRRPAALRRRRLRVPRRAHVPRSRRALVLDTDGVTEGATRGGEMYGARAMEARARAAGASSRAGAQALVDALRGDVRAFAAGADPADDLAILVLAFRWTRVPRRRAPERRRRALSAR